MKNDGQINQVQAQIGQVQGQMKENIQMVMQRQENLDSLADKSSTLQASASQFSQVASRVREDQELQKYKFYAGVLFAVLALVCILLFWHSPGKLITSLVLVGILAMGGFYYFQTRRQSAVRLANSILHKEGNGDIESA